MKYRYGARLGKRVITWEEDSVEKLIGAVYNSSAEEDPMFTSAIAMIMADRIEVLHEVSPRLFSWTLDITYEDIKNKDTFYDVIELDKDSCYIVPKR